MARGAEIRARVSCVALSQHPACVDRQKPMRWGNYPATA